MKSQILLLTGMALLSLCGCSKKKENDLQPDGCLLNNYYLKATIGGTDWCANTSLFADYAIHMTINGISSNGATMTLELDDVTPGTFSIRQDRNHLIYTDPMANGFESTNDNPGTLVIISNDTAANLIKGNFNVSLKSPLTGNLSVNNGTFMVYYTD